MCEHIGGTHNRVDPLPEGGDCKCLDTFFQDGTNKVCQPCDDNFCGNCVNANNNCLSNFFY